jgi:DNA-binding response OmpR family regulator
VRILLLEDQPDIAEPVVDMLRNQRYEVVWASRLSEAYEALTAATFDLAVLDVMLPRNEDAGFVFARHLRDAGYPGHILFLSARDSVDDKVFGLDAGGDDYLSKPFSLHELAARIRTLLRRTAQTKRSLLERGRLSVDLTARRVTWNGGPVALSEREFMILEAFALHPERVFTVNELLDRFFPGADSGPRVVRVYVSQLRHKIADSLIETMPGGYRLGPT